MVSTSRLSSGTWSVAVNCMRSVFDWFLPLKVSRKTLSEIVNGKASVSSEMAVRLELAFGKSAQSWLGHQAAYDLWHLDSKRSELGIKRVSG